MVVTPALLALGVLAGMAARARTLSALRSPDFTYADVDDVFSLIDTVTLATVTLFALGALAWAVTFIAWLSRAWRDLDRTAGRTFAGWLIAVLNVIVPCVVVAGV